jgi:hypothetical protein
MESTHLSIRLEVDVCDDRLSGSLRDPAGTDLPFSGWLGLMAAIDALLPVEPSQREESTP